jgi:GT2 family glycosyltransferase
MYLHYAAARLAGWLRPARPKRVASPAETKPAEPGISVVIPSRNGRGLLEAQLPGIVRDLAVGEIIVVDNGSEDGTADWLAARWPAIAVEISAQPLSFARAVNRGIARARCSLVCLLNNDMLLEPGFFRALTEAFEKVPDLFCATAQIRFPAGARREETGKAVMAQTRATDFPVRCDEPLPGEDLTFVLYGSGGCSVYDAAKLRALGGADESYQPAYVEDLDLGYRAWLRGWPTVYVAGALVEHRHRATTSRYYTDQELDTILEVNYLKFLARAVSSRKVFGRLWARALRRLTVLGTPSARAALRAAARIAISGGPAATTDESEEMVLALTDGSVACFPGVQPTGMPRRVVFCESLEEAFREPAAGCDWILVAMVDRLATPPANLLAQYIEITLVRRPPGSTAAPLAFHAALGQVHRKWRPAIFYNELFQSETNPRT